MLLDSFHAKRPCTRLMAMLGVPSIVIGMVACQVCQAEAITDEAHTSHARQDDPVRRRGAVEALGRRVVAQYSNKQFAAYGILDVTKAPYLADPTGLKDSTWAIQQAMKDARDARLITFVPGGTYRVSDTITCIQGVVTPDVWPFGKSALPGSPLTTGASSFNYQSDYFPCVLMGSRTGQRSTIKLAPRSPGFGNPGKPKPLIHVWARTKRADAGALSEEALSAPAYVNEPEPPVSYNQMIIDIDLVLGPRNPGATGIDHEGAQGSTIEDVTVDATGAFAGIQKAPAGGGGVHDVTVLGGRYGLYLRGPAGYRGTQPVPVVSHVTLKRQTERAILYDGRGPLTVVGGWIEGAGVEGQSPSDPPWNGAMNFVDTVFSTPKAGCTIATSHSVYLHNAYFEKSRRIACVEGQPPLTGKLEGWTHVEEYAAAATLQYPQWMGGGLRQDAIYLNGNRVAAFGPILQSDSGAPPTDVQSRHALAVLPSFDKDVANVRAERYGAQGDGKSDDAPAIQRAIDESEAVFLPKGEYRLSHPLILRSHTRLFGVSPVLSTLSPLASPTFTDPEHPVPIIETVDDPKADTELAFVELRLPMNDPAAYALRWRAGRNSVVRDIRPVPTAWEPHAPPALSPMIRIEASGGGRWYNLYQDGWWFQGPDYRHLLVEGTHEPLSFYMLNPEHGRSDAQVEFHDAQNIRIYSLKAEGIYTLLWMRDCRDIQIYGYGGMAAPRPGWPLFKIDDSRDFLIANADPDEYPNEPTLKYWDAAGVASDPQKWLLIADRPRQSEPPFSVRGVDQVVLYQRGALQAAE